jgi:hypothetical protein
MDVRREFVGNGSLYDKADPIAADLSVAHAIGAIAQDRARVDEIGDALSYPRVRNLVRILASVALSGDIWANFARIGAGGRKPRVGRGLNFVRACAALGRGACRFAVGSRRTSRTPATASHRSRSCIGAASVRMARGAGVRTAM